MLIAYRGNFSTSTLNTYLGLIILTNGSGGSMLALPEWANLASDASTCPCVLLRKRWQPFQVRGFLVFVVASTVAGLSVTPGIFVPVLLAVLRIGAYPGRHALILKS